ncbi:MAG TPA: phage minor capsid protein, partial [Aquirhabdus sp.]
MLTATQFDAIAIPIRELYEKYNQTVLNDIARRMVAAMSPFDIARGIVSIPESAAWQMQRLIESGMVYQDALDALQNLTGQSSSILDHAFKQAGVK